MTLGFNPPGFLPLGQMVDDGIHGQGSEIAAELDQADAATIWALEIDGVNRDLDQRLRSGEGSAALWRRFLEPGSL